MEEALLLGPQIMENGQSHIVNNEMMTTDDNTEKSAMALGLCMEVH